MLGLKKRGAVLFFRIVIAPKTTINLECKSRKQFDCIYCKNVISHTDTEGIKQIIKELDRVMKHDGECYLTLGSNLC